MKGAEMLGLRYMSRGSQGILGEVHCCFFVVFRQPKAEITLVTLILKGHHDRPSGPKFSNKFFFLKLELHLHGIKDMQVRYG